MRGGKYPPSAYRKDLVSVHADGGDCHGTQLVNGECPKCGIIPDMQSIELWPPEDVNGRKVEEKKMVETITAYRTGHSDGYRHYYDGPIYRTYAEAESCGRKKHGNYAIDPVPVNVIEDGAGGGWIVEGGPLKFAETVRAEENRRQEILRKLTPEEQKILGVKP